MSITNFIYKHEDIFITNFFNNFYEITKVIEEVNGDVTVILDAMTRKTFKRSEVEMWKSDVMKEHSMFKHLNFVQNYGTTAKIGG